MVPLRERDFGKEIVLIASQSSGPGGQHVNRVNTHVRLRFNVVKSDLLNAQEKARIINRLGQQITKTGDLIITSQTERSQLRNKKEALEKFYRLIEIALLPDKKRIASHPPKTASIKRLEKKRRQGEKKIWRRKLGKQSVRDDE